jgi:hypothetical protein
MWYMHIIPAPGKLRQENHEFEDNLSYMARPCLKKEKKKDFIPPLSQTLFLVVGTKLTNPNSIPCFNEA